jgi:signal transduction histidine kinase/HAMP domain-containing protein
MRRSSIRKQLITTLIQTALIPLLAVGVTLSIYNFIVGSKYIMEFQESATILVTNNISIFLHEQEKRIHSFLKVNYLPEMSGKQQSDALLLFLFTPGSLTHGHLHGHFFENVTLLDDQGKSVVFHSLTQTLTASQLPDMTEMNEFLIPFHTERTYYSPAYFDETTGKPLIKIAVPIKDIRTRSFQGVLILEMSLMSMRELITDIRIGRNGIAYIVNPVGRILVHPDPSVVHRDTYIKVPGKSQIMNGTQGEKAVLTASRIRIDDYLLTLSVITEIPANEIYSHIYRSLIIIGIIIILSLGGAVILGLAATHKIAIPIESLAMTVKKISGGNISQKAEIRSVNELNDLAEAYNIMTSRLTSTIDDLEYKKNLLNSAINAFSHPFYIIDVQEYTIKLANAASNFETLTTKSKCYNLVYGYDRPCHERQLPCPIQEIKKTGKSVVLKHVHRHGDRSNKTYEVHGYPIFNNKGDVVQIIEYSIDITEKENILAWTKDQEEQLIRADKLASLGTLTAGMAHEINNPNQVILSNGLFLQESWGTIRDILDKYFEDIGDFLIGGMNYSDFKDSAENCHAVIPESARKIANIVDELKRFSLKDHRVSHSEVDISKVIKTSVKLLSYIINKSMIKITMDLSPALLILKGDYRRLEQVFVNLLQNSFQARRGNEINIFISASCCVNDSRIIIEIKDDGTGISPANILRITDPFFTTKRNKGGTGLGLSVSASIIRDHNGILEFESVVGEGTTARIILPIEEYNGRMS